MLDPDCVRKKSADFLERAKAVWLLFSTAFELLLNFAEQETVLLQLVPAILPVWVKLGMNFSTCGIKAREDRWYKED